MPIAGKPVTVAVRSEGLRFTFALRPNSSDPTVLSETFHGRYHLPPIPLTDVRRALDLGANVGLTMAHLAALCPGARIVGVELDPETADLARRNIARWRDRCRVLEAAVWYTDEPVRYRITPGGECGATIAESGERTAEGLSLGTLLDRLGWERADFVKMDIEGAEREVLRRNTGWAWRVRSLKVETHVGYSREECRDDLSALGFRAAFDARHPGAVAGVRDAG